jgi:Uncharacterised conserved protein/CLEC16A C-terminal
LYGQLAKHKKVNSHANQTQVVEHLRTIAELMIWGDTHNPLFFEFFCEKSMLRFFLDILEDKCDRNVKVQLIQTLSILIQNISDERSVFYLLSNNFVNDLIVHQFDFNDEELLAYYISFLKTLSLKLNERTILFFFNERANDFPLYTEAIKFFKNREQMVRIAVRTLSLNVYKIDYPPLRKFVLNRSAVPYFSNLVWFLRDECLELDALLTNSTYQTRGVLEEMMENVIDLLFYLQDILNLGVEELSQTLIDQLLSHFTLPVLLGSLNIDSDEKDSTDRICPQLALYLLSQIFMVFTHRSFINSIVASLFQATPPRLVESLIMRPPPNPIKSPFPLASVLFPATQLLSESKDIQLDTAGTPPREDHSDMKRTDRTDIPVDENLKPRSKAPEIGPVSSPMQLYPNYNTPSMSNPWRDAFFALFHSDDERLVFGAAGVLLCILQNADVDRMLLDSVGLCPQKHMRSLHLLDELTSAASGDLFSTPPTTRPLRSHSVSVKPISTGMHRGLDMIPSWSSDRPVVLLSIEVSHVAGEEHAAVSLRIDPVSVTGMPVSLGKGHKKLHITTQSENKSSDNTAELASPQDDYSPVSTYGPPDSPSSVRARSYSADVRSLSHRASPHTPASPAELEATPVTQRSTSPDPLGHLGTVLRPVENRSGPTTPTRNMLTLHGNAASPFGISKPSRSVGNRSGSSGPSYARALVDHILYALQQFPPHRIVTIRILLELLNEFVHDPNSHASLLYPEHRESLSAVHHMHARDLRRRTSFASNDSVLDVFYEEWNEVYTAPRVREMISNAMSLLPVAASSASGIPLAFRRPAGEIEVSKKCTHLFFLSRQALYRLSCDTDEKLEALRDAPAHAVGTTVDLSMCAVLCCFVLFWCPPPPPPPPAHFSYAFLL